MVLDHRYRLLTRLGSGGMGAVYLAEHLTLGRKFAIKVLKQELCARREFVERFQREARAATAIDHPHVIDVVDTGFFPDGTAYYAMEHLQGEDLGSTLRASGRIEWPRVRHFALQICDALASAHAKGIIHRDLKPENCFRITRKADHDFIKILDFGIAKLLGPPGSSLTDTGQLLGTAYYMAPEQAMGQKVDHRVDVYALGAMLYQLLTGQVPFDGRNNVEVLSALLTRTPVPIHLIAPDAGIPPELEDIVERAMQREPGWRYPSMSAFSEALARIEVPNEEASTAAPTLGPASERASQDAFLQTAAAPVVHTAVASVARAAVAPTPPSEPDAGPPSTGLGLAVADTPVALSWHPPLEHQPPDRPRVNLRWIVGLGLMVVAGVGVVVTMLRPGATPPSTDPPLAARPVPASIVTAPQPVVDPAARPAVPAERGSSSGVVAPQPAKPAPAPPSAPLVEPEPPPTKMQPLARARPVSAPRTHKDVDAVLRKVAQQVRATCHSRFGDRVGMTVRVEAATGTLSSRTVLAPHEEGTAMWTCIVGLLDRAKFPVFVGGDYIDKIEFEITPNQG